MARILLISRDEMLISRLKEAIKSHPELSLKAAPTYPAAGSWNLLLPEIQSVSDWILCLGQLENDGIPVLPVCTGHVFTEIVQSGLPLMEYLELPLPPDAAQILSVRLQQEYPGPIGESPDSRVLDLWHRVAWGSVSPGRRYIHQVCDRLGIPEEQRYQEQYLSVSCVIHHLASSHPFLQKNYITIPKLYATNRQTGLIL